MKRYFLPLFLFCGLSGCDEIKPPLRTVVDGEKALQVVLASIDHNHPGRGLADYPSDELADVPKSYALILLGAVDEAKAGHLARVNELGRKAGEWLVENADVNGDGVIGWGVPIAWDAYGDGSVNPENTEYAISTAIAVDALLGWADYVDSAQKAKIMILVEKAFEPYLNNTMRTPAGMLPYSLLVQDRKYDTFNSAVYLAGQMQRYAEITSRPELRSALQSAADATMSALIKNKKISEARGAWYWNYSIQEDSPNDLPHAGYIVEGVLTYIENNGSLSASLNGVKIFDHLMEFFGDDGRVRGWPNFRPDIKTAPRLYDLSISAQLMCRFKGRDSGKLFLSEIENYRSAAGGYLKYPKDFPNNRQVAEYESYLYRALIACGFSVNEN